MSPIFYSLKQKCGAKFNKPAAENNRSRAPGLGEPIIRTALQKYSASGWTVAHNPVLRYV